MALNVRPGVDLRANRGPEIIRYTSVVAVLATFAVVGRIISRKIQRTTLDASDVMIVLGLIGCWVETVTEITSTFNGLGKHVEVVPLENMIKILQAAFASEIIYSITFPIIKISILLLYRSLFPGRGFAILTKIVGLYVIAWGFAILLTSIFSCRPVSGFWDITKPSVCTNARNFFIGNSVPNISADVFILALPVSKVSHLQMPLRSKIVVSGFFLLGGIVCVISGVRLYFLLAIDKADYSWTGSGVAIWSSIELNVAVISACLPTIRPLLKGFEHTIISLRSFAINWSWAVDRFKSKSSSQASFERSQQSKNKFHQLQDNPLEVIPAAKSADTRDLESAI